MTEYWKQKNWMNLCEVTRPRFVWIASTGLDDCVRGGTYMLYLVVNHRPTHWELMDWLSDELGVDPMHFSFWSKDVCDKAWSQAGTYVPDSDLPKGTVRSEYDDNSVNNRKAPEGYLTYDDCMIAVDPNIWESLKVDYTREEGIRNKSPEEEILREINDELRLIEGLLECLVERVEGLQPPNSPTV